MYSCAQPGLVVVHASTTSLDMACNAKASKIEVHAPSSKMGFCVRLLP